MRATKVLNIINYLQVFVANIPASFARRLLLIQYKIRIFLIIQNRGIGANAKPLRKSLGFACYNYFLSGIIYIRKAE